MKKYEERGGKMKKNEKAVENGEENCQKGKNE